MLFEALEILQSAGENEDTFVTDFARYKLISILTVYMQLMMSTFLLSQEYLGKDTSYSAKMSCNLAFLR